MDGLIILCDAPANNVNAVPYPVPLDPLNAILGGTILSPMKEKQGKTLCKPDRQTTPTPGSPNPTPTPTPNPTKTKNKPLLRRIHPLRDKAEDGDGAHEQDRVVELRLGVSGLAHIQIHFKPNSTTLDAG